MSAAALQGLNPQTLSDNQVGQAFRAALRLNAPDLAAGFGSPAQIGELFLTKFLVPFEVVSLLLLVAAVGAVVLARREPDAV